MEHLEAFPRSISSKYDSFFLPNMVSNRPMNVLKIHNCRCFIWWIFTILVHFHNKILSDRKATLDTASFHILLIISGLSMKMLIGDSFGLVVWFCLLLIYSLLHIHRPTPENANFGTSMILAFSLFSAWVSAQSDRSLCCPHEEALGP